MASKPPVTLIGRSHQFVSTAIPCSGLHLITTISTSSRSCLPQQNGNLYAQRGPNQGKCQGYLQARQLIGNDGSEHHHCQMRLCPARHARGRSAPDRPAMSRPDHFSLDPMDHAVRVDILCIVHCSLFLATSRAAHRKTQCRSPQCLIGCEVAREYPWHCV